MKTCKKCGTEKPLMEFHKHPGMKDGHLNECKSCRLEYIKSWGERNSAKVSSYKKKYQENHPERVVASRAAWYAANPYKCLEWQAANPEALRINGHNYRARKREAGGKLSTGLAERLLKLQRGKCACGCKQHLGTNYHLDHIMPLALGGSNTDDNMQLLTATCNLQKHAKHPVDFMQSRGFLL